jgi:hypothetical protein
MSTPFLGILMIIGTFGLVALGAVAFVYSRLSGKSLARNLVLGIGAAWIAIYIVSLTATSLASQERLLGLNEDKQFCGFYIDCHMQIAVSRVDTTSRLAHVKARGVFYVVRLRVSSTAVRAQLSLVDPHVVIRDANGRQYERQALLEENVASQGAPYRSLTTQIGPEESFLTTVVFELPADAPSPRLLVTEGIWADKLIELFLIGDEDSLLHKRTTFELAIAAKA